MKRKIKKLILILIILVIPPYFLYNYYIREQPAKYIYYNYTDNQNFFNKTHVVKNMVCMIITSENTIMTRGFGIWKTWSQYCNETFFACNCLNVKRLQELPKGSEIPIDLEKFKDVKDMPLLHMNITEAYDKMGIKVFEMMKRTYNQNPKYDWYLMADDDTYIFIENFKNFINTKKPTEPYVYGHKYTHLVPNGYIPGGPGIIFTQESLKRLAKKIETKECDQDLDPYGDISIARCMNRVNVSIGNSELENYLFDAYFPINPFNRAKDALSIHYVKPELMHSIYGMRVRMGYVT